MNSANKKQICDLIKKSSNPLILIPENFDIDALSGAMGLYLFLEKNKKKPHIACSANISEKLLFSDEKFFFENSIQGECIYKITFGLGENQIKELSYAQEGNILKINLATLGNEFILGKPNVDLMKFNYDLIITAGSPDLRSLGHIYQDNVCFFSETAIINIDCQEKNEIFGSINLIQPEASVSEIIAGIAVMLSLDFMDKKIADLFLTGIVFKTRNFQAANIKADTFNMVSVLMRTGADREEIIRRLADINLLAAEKIEFYPSSKITKQIVDRINRDSPWYSQQEQDRRKRIALDGLKFLTLNQKFFYLAALLGAIPGVMLLERANPVLAPIFKNGDNVLLEEDIIAIGEKTSLSYSSVFFKKTESVFPLLNDPKLDLPLNASTQILDNPGEKTIGTYLEAAENDPEEENIAMKNKAEKIGVPKKISVPLYGIYGDIQEVGLTASGAMGVPSNFISAGWFKLGARPGENGNAVIAGHLDTYSGKGGIFWNLNKMKKGDYVYVTDENNNKMRFQVIKSVLYDDENAPMSEIFGPNSKAHLNLITCDGAWNQGKKSYDKRLVVFTEYAPE